MNIKGLTLFSGAGVGEYYLSNIGVRIICANELVKKRADLYHAVYPNTRMICGDINDANVFAEIISQSKGVDFILASPPCQGMSVANKFKDKNGKDPRNLLIFKAIEAIEKLKPKFVMIENVPALLKMKFSVNGSQCSIVEILHKTFPDYKIDFAVVDAADYGVPQKRLRAIIKMWKKEFAWPWPQKNKTKVTIKDAIGNLPSLEAGEDSGIKWHFAREHSPLQIDAMRYTATGHSAFENDIHFPRKKDGSRVHGFNTTYRRMDWDKPCATITMRNDAISSQRNVHPGRPLPDGTFSDARVLTPLELMLCDSLPADWRIPNDTPEILIRQVIGESIPPLLVKKLVQEIKLK